MRSKFTVDVANMRFRYKNTCVSERQILLHGETVPIETCSKHPQSPRRHARLRTRTRCATTSTTSSGESLKILRKPVKLKSISSMLCSGRPHQILMPDFTSRTNDQIVKDIADFERETDDLDEAFEKVEQFWKAELKFCPGMEDESMGDESLTDKGESFEV